MSHQLNRLIVQNEIKLEHITSPATPDASESSVYAAADNHLYLKNSAGTDQKIGDMSWNNEWVAKEYYNGDTVQQDGWLMVANKTTTDSAAPQLVGTPSGVYPLDTLASKSQNTKSLIFGMRYNTTSTGYLSGYRVYTVIGNSYTMYYVVNPTTTPQIREIISFQATTDGWRTFNTSSFIQVNTELDIVVVVTEPDPTPTETLANYDYQKPQNYIAPTTGQIVHAGKELSKLSIHITDDDTTSRAAMLAALTPGDIIQIDDLRWAIQSTTLDGGGQFYDVVVAPAQQWFGTGVAQFSFQTVVATPITYNDNVDYWISDANISGLLSLTGDYATATVNDTQYGIDAIVQYTEVSSDWDFAAYTGTANGGGSGESATLQESYDISPAPHITTTLGTLTIKNGNVDEKEDVIEVLNNSDAQTFAVTGNGDIKNIVNTQQYSTGVLTGGSVTITAPGVTVFSVTAGTGLVVDQAAGTFVSVAWDAVVNKALADFAPITKGTSILYFDSSGVLGEQSTSPTPTERRDRIYVGGLAHPDLTTIVDASTVARLITTPSNQLMDFVEIVGPINVDGNIVSSVTGLTIIKSLGDMYSYGVNFGNDIKNPSIVSIPVMDSDTGGDTFVIAYRSTLSADDIDVHTSAATAIIPAEYDDGNGASSPGVVGNNEYTAMRYIITPGGSSIIMPGQFKYNSIGECIAGIDIEAFVIPNTLNSGGLIIGYLVTKGNSPDFSDTATTRIIQASKFGTGGTGSSVSNMQNTYDNSNQPQITTNDGGQSVQYKRGTTGGDTDVVFEILNGADTSTFSLTGEGTISIGELGVDEYVMPQSRGTDTQLLTTNGSGVVTWQTPVQTSKFSHQLLSYDISADSVSYVPASNFTWDHSEYSSYTNGTLRFWVDWTDIDADIRVQDITNAATLGVVTNIGASGVQVLALTNPAADALIELQIRQSGAGSTSPIIRSATLEFTISAVLSSTIKYSRSAVTDVDSPYTILSSDEIVGVDTTTAAVTVVLPQISTIGGGDNYKKYFIVDEGGNATTNNITISTSGGDTINGNPGSLLIAADNATYSLYSGGGTNWTIF